jgi:hypothetical protein
MQAEESIKRPRRAARESFIPGIFMRSEISGNEGKPLHEGAGQTGHKSTLRIFGAMVTRGMWDAV